VATDFAVLTRERQPRWVKDSAGRLQPPPQTIYTTTCPHVPALFPVRRIGPVRTWTAGRESLFAVPVRARAGPPERKPTLMKRSSRSSSVDMQQERPLRSKHTAVEAKGASEDALGSWASKPDLQAGSTETLPLLHRLGKMGKDKKEPAPPANTVVTGSMRLQDAVYEASGMPQTSHLATWTHGSPGIRRERSVTTPATARASVGG
jgi:hypothetical protein